MNVILSYSVKASKNDFKLIEDYLKPFGFQVNPVTEFDPANISIRCELVKNCHACIVLTSRSYQIQPFCMEIINYAKDQKKIIFAFNRDAGFRPFGALGAISVGYSHNGLVELKTENNSCLDDLVKSLKDIQKNLTPTEILSNKKSEKPDTSNIQLNSTQASCKQIDVLVSFHFESKPIADLIEKALKLKEINYSIEESTAMRTVTSVKNSKCIVLIMSPEYEASHVCKSIVDEARASSKTLIPVSITKSWKPKSWLGLVISGRLFFRIFDQNQAYTIKHDSTPMNDLCFEIAKTLAPKLTFSERDKSIIDFLNKQIDECKIKLSNANKWPPKHKNKEKEQLKPITVEIKERIDLIIPPSNIKYTVKRVDFVAPAQLYDSNGLPIRRTFDAMISYQWANQPLVLDVYMQLHLNNLNTWFDIWGQMEGNTNDSMATAIENSKVLLVFLSTKYQQSENCKLEFKYACSLGKSFVFILTETVSPEPWLEPYFSQMPKFEIIKPEDMFITDEKGWSRLDLIAQTLRDIALKQPDISDLFELNQQIVELRELLNDALDEIDTINKSSRFKICTRCNKNYDDNSTKGCKKHSAYFLGGTLIQAKWVCCNQHTKDSQGCLDADHISIERNWELDENYGTYTWSPA